MGGVTTPEYWLSDVFPAHVSDPEEELDVKLGGVVALLLPTFAFAPQSEVL